jgi:DNA-binding winged helix-turn-helix (wHTH) protein
VLFLFEDFVLDSDRRELRAGGTIVPIEPQAFDLLVYLIENRDRVISKDDLIASVWGGRIVSDSTLDSRINAVRKALGDSGKEQRLIRTIARKGVRFVGEVRQTARDPANGHGADLLPPLITDRPSIAVLPFENLLEDHALELMPPVLRKISSRSLHACQDFLSLPAHPHLSMRNVRLKSAMSALN